MADEHEELFRFKPKQPEFIDEKRSYLAVATWIFKIEQYFQIVSTFNPAVLILMRAKFCLHHRFYPIQLLCVGIQWCNQDFLQTHDKNVKSQLIENFYQPTI